MNLIDRIDEHLLAQRAERSKRERSSHYPSSAGAVINGEYVGKCRRAQVYSWLNVPESNPVDAGGIWKMEMGNALHILVARLLEDSGLDIIDEIPFKEQVAGLEHPVSGRADNLFLADGHITGLEIKSSFGRGVKSWQMAGTPKPEALLQTLVYLEYTDIAQYYIIGIGRDNAYRTQWITTLSEDGQLLIQSGGRTETFPVGIKAILDAWAEVERFAHDDTLPERDYKAAIKEGEVKDKYQRNKVEYKSDWQCSYCQWCNECWKETLDVSRETGKMFYGKEEVE